MLFQLTASCRPSPKCQQQKGLSKATLSSPDCGHLLQREVEAMAACWVPVHHCCVFCPEKERHLYLLVLNESPSLICHWHRSGSLQYCFQKHLVSYTFCSVQVKAKIQKLSGTYAIVLGATASTFL